jgi:hypothetical protein
MADPLPTEDRTWPAAEDRGDQTVARLAERLKRRRELNQLHRGITRPIQGPSA